MFRRAHSDTDLGEEEEGGGVDANRRRSFGASTSERHPFPHHHRRYHHAPNNNMAVMRGTGVLVSLHPEFAERQQSLKHLVRRMSNTKVAEHETVRFKFELQNYHLTDVELLCRNFKTSVVRGLDEELAQVRLLNDGPNVVAPARQVPLVVKLLLSLVSGFAPLLWVACFFVFLSWKPFGSPPTNVYNLALAIVLIIVIVVSGSVTFYQEEQATRILAGFDLLIPQVATVVRGGDTVTVPASELVVGDIVVL
jgi:magnesium-transporting ATPase (P-type)